MAATRITITVEEKWLEAFRRQAKKQKMPLSYWLAVAAREQLPKRVAKSLPPATRPGRQAEG